MGLRFAIVQKVHSLGYPSGGADATRGVGGPVYRRMAVAACKRTRSGVVSSRNAHWRIEVLVFVQVSPAPDFSMAVGEGQLSSVPMPDAPSSPRLCRRRLDREIAVIDGEVAFLDEHERLGRARFGNVGLLPELPDRVVPTQVVEATERDASKSSPSQRRSSNELRTLLPCNAPAGGPCPPDIGKRRDWCCTGTMPAWTRSVLVASGMAATSRRPGLV